MTEFQYVFCGKKIKEAEKVSSVLLTTHWLDEEKQEDQQLFCHLVCFKSKCDDTSHIFIEE